jgi:hypothetical protein
MLKSVATSVEGTSASSKTFRSRFPSLCPRFAYAWASEQGSAAAVYRFTEPGGGLETLDILLNAGPRPQKQVGRADARAR